MDSEEQANDIKAKLEAGSLDFAGAATEFSKCPSAARGGKLGKFSPGKMVKEFDDIVFGLYDTGEITYEDAIAHADSPNDLRLMIKLGNETDASSLDHATRGLTIENPD